MLIQHFKQLIVLICNELRHRVGANDLIGRLRHREPLSRKIRIDSSTGWVNRLRRGPLSSKIWIDVSSKSVWLMEFVAWGIPMNFVASLDGVTRDLTMITKKIFFSEISVQNYLNSFAELPSQYYFVPNLDIHWCSQ